MQKTLLLIPFILLLTGGAYLFSSSFSATTPETLSESIITGPFEELEKQCKQSYIQEQSSVLCVQSLNESVTVAKNQDTIKVVSIENPYILSFKNAQQNPDLKGHSVLYFLNEALFDCTDTQSVEDLVHCSVDSVFRQTSDASVTAQFAVSGTIYNSRAVTVFEGLYANDNYVTRRNFNGIDITLIFY